MIATTSRGLAWREAKENSEYCLQGNAAWQELIRAYLQEVEQNHREATVTTRIYNPCNLLMGLYRLVKLNSGDALPSAEIVVSSKDGSPARIVLGSLVWNGKLVTTVADVLPEGIPTLFDLFFAAALEGGPWAAEEHLIAQHGLSYVLVECADTSGAKDSERLVVEEGVVHRLKENKAGLMDFGAFYSAHQDYLQALIEDFDSWAHGIG